VVYGNVGAAQLATQIRGDRAADALGLSADAAAALAVAVERSGDVVSFTTLCTLLGKHDTSSRAVEAAV